MSVIIVIVILALLIWVPNIMFIILISIIGLAIVIISHGVKEGNKIKNSHDYAMGGTGWDTSKPKQSKPKPYRRTYHHDGYEGGGYQGCIDPDN